MPSLRVVTLNLKVMGRHLGAPRIMRHRFCLQDATLLEQQTHSAMVLTERGSGYH